MASYAPAITRLSDEDFAACMTCEVLPPRLAEIIAMENILVAYDDFLANTKKSRRTLRNKLIYRDPRTGRFLPVYMPSRSLQSLSNKIKLSIRYVYGASADPVVIVFPFPKEGV